MIVFQRILRTYDHVIETRQLDVTVDVLLTSIGIKEDVHVGKDSVRVIIVHIAVCLPVPMSKDKVLDLVEGCGSENGFIFPGRF